MKCGGPILKLNISYFQMVSKELWNVNQVLFSYLGRDRSILVLVKHVECGLERLQFVWAQFVRHFEARFFVPNPTANQIALNIPTSESNLKKRGSFTKRSIVLLKQSGTEKTENASL